MTRDFHHLEARRISDDLNRIPSLNQVPHKKARINNEVDIPSHIPVPLLIHHNTQQQVFHTGVVHGLAIFPIYFNNNGRQLNRHHKTVRRCHDKYTHKTQRAFHFTFSRAIPTPSVIASFCPSLSLLLCVPCLCPRLDVASVPTTSAATSSTFVGPLSARTRANPQWTSTTSTALAARDHFRARPPSCDRQRLSTCLYDPLLYPR